MAYQFFVDTYETERLKTLGVWNMFIEGESKGGMKAHLPGPGDEPCTERPDL